MSRPRSEVKFHVYVQPDTAVWWVWYWSEAGRNRVSTASLVTGPLSQNDYTLDQAQKLVNQATGITTDNTSASKKYTVLWLKEYIRDRLEHEGKSKKTLNWYLVSLQKFGEYFGDNIPINRFRTQDIWEFQRFALDTNCKPVTVNTYCRGLQGIINRLVKQGVVDKNPFNEFERLREDKINKHLSLDQLQEFLKVLDRPAAEGDRTTHYISRRLIRMLVFTGLRRQEILILERGDVDLKNIRLLATNIKSEDKHKRWIAISEEITDDINFFLSNFDTSYDGRPGFPFYRCHPDTLTHWCKEHLVEAGLPEYHTHNLRHTFATLALENGWSIRELQRYLDHSNTSVTEIYSHDTASFRAPNLGIKKSR